MLTKEVLDSMLEGSLIGHGLVKNHPENGIYMTEEFPNRMLRWVAKRGITNDWAIYTGWANASIDNILKTGQKVQDKKHIQFLVPCDEEALALYRH